MAILGAGVEVLIPCDLIKQIAQDVVASSETEPCGLRGCIMYINLEEDETSAASGRRNSSSIDGNYNSKEFRRITCIKPIGSNPVPTFELTLNLKRCKTGWFNSVSSKLFHNSLFGGKQPIVISDSYQLSKKKLFRWRRRATLEEREVDRIPSPSGNSHSKQQPIHPTNRTPTTHFLP